MFRIRILDRYILREMLTPFLLSMSVLMLVLFLEKMFKFADLIVAKGATLAASAKVLIYVVPGFLVITIPMSLIVASLTTFATLSADSEITALKASRVSLYQMIRPVFFFALITFGCTAFTSIVLVPHANAALKQHLFEMVKSSALVGIEPGIFSTSFDGMVIYVDKMDTIDNLQGVFIADERSAKEPYVIVAQQGKLIPDQQSLNVTLAIQNGSIHTQPRDDDSYTLMEFDTARLNLDISSVLLQKKTPGRGFEDIATLELIDEIKRLHEQNKPAYIYETELHKRFSIPFSCIILGLIGAPLGIRNSRSGKSAGIAIALIVFLAYFIILSSATNLSETGTVPAIRAYWVPNSLMVLAALMLIFKKGHELNFGIWNTLAGAFYTALNRIKGRS